MPYLTDDYLEPDAVNPDYGIADAPTTEDQDSDDN